MPVRGDRQLRVGYEINLVGAQDLYFAVRASRSVPPAQRDSPCESADAKRHERATIIRVDADPVPSDRLQCRGIRSTTRGRATPRRSPRRRCPARPMVPADGHVRQAVVIARRLRRRPLAAHARIAVEQRRLRSSRARCREKSSASMAAV